MRLNRLSGLFAAFAVGVLVAMSSPASAEDVIINNYPAEDDADVAEPTDPVVIHSTVPAQPAAVPAPMPVIVDEDDEDDSDIHQGVSLGPRASYFDSKDGDGVWYPGAQLRFYLGRAFALEGSVDYRQNDFDGFDIHTWPVQATLLAYIIPGEHVSPFLLGGAGWYFTSIDPDAAGIDETTDDRFGWHVGAGLQAHLNETWSVDGSYRYLFLEEFSSQAQNNVAKKDYDDSGSQITVGLNFHF